MYARRNRAARPPGRSLAAAGCVLTVVCVAFGVTTSTRSRLGATTSTRPTPLPAGVAVRITPDARARRPQKPVGCVLHVPGASLLASSGPGGFVGDRRPVLRWKVAFVADEDLTTPFTHAGRRVGAYRLVAKPAAGEDPAATCGVDRCDWDSGRVAGSVHAVQWGGRDLAAGDRVQWRVGVWDDAGLWCGYSEEATFEVSLVRPGDWGGASWIQAPGNSTPANACHLLDDGRAANAAPVFRRTFAVPATVVSARLHMAGLGIAEPELAGVRVSDDLLGPSWTRYDRRVFFRTYNVTALLAGRAGSLVSVGALVANGWWNPAPLRFWGRVNFREALTVGQRPVLKLLLRMRDASGAVTDVATGPSDWFVAESHVRRHDLFLGEHHDGGRAHVMQGWSDGAAAAAVWQRALPAAGPLGVLQEERLPPVRRGPAMRPVSGELLADGSVTLDLGRNIAGVCEVSLARVRDGMHAPRLQLRYAELLKPDGRLNFESSTAGQIKECNPNACPGQPCNAMQRDEYQVRGTDGDEVFSPRFSWKGFRYVEVTGWPEGGGGGGGRAAAVRDSVTCYAVRNSMPRVGHVRTSNPAIDSLLDMAENTFASNLLGVQSDCPHREKLGYTGDQVGVAESMIATYDMSQFYDKAITDVCDAQLGNGGLTETAPFVGIADSGLGGKSGPMGWQAWGPAAVRWHRQYYATMPSDRSSRATRCVHRMVEQLEREPAQSMVEHGLGDWMSLEQKCVPLTGRGWEEFSYASLAAVSPNSTTRRVYSRKAARVVSRSNARFLDSTGLYRGDARDRDTGKRYRWSGTQAGQAFPLYAGHVPSPTAVAGAAQHLIKSLDRRCRHLEVGLWGVKWVLMALGDLGLNVLAVDVLTRTSYPSFGFMQKEGATTLWEGWESSSYYSHNHPMLGSFVQWAMQSLVGIRPDPSAAGFDRVIIRPQPPPQLRSAGGEYESVRGTVLVRWEWEGSDLQWVGSARRLRVNVSIPPLVVAQVWIPAVAPPLLLGGRPVDPLEAEYHPLAQALVVTVHGGNYDFESLYHGGPPPGMPVPRDPSRQDGGARPDGEMVLTEAGGGSLVIQLADFVYTGCSGVSEHRLGWDLCGVSPPHFPGGGKVRGRVTSVAFRRCSQRHSLSWRAGCGVPRNNQDRFRRNGRRVLGSAQCNGPAVPVTGDACFFTLEPES